jgi:hypothetical protein
MPNAADLLQKASHARQLAEVLTDAEAIRVLLAIAAEFEILATGHPPSKGIPGSREGAPREPYLRTRREPGP